jgi:hypothetical protein
MIVTRPEPQYAAWEVGIMEADYEGCRKILAELVAAESSSARERNEATTRIQVIDRLLFECLGWSRADCVAEAAHGGEYADYTCSAPRPILIVEAKREGNYFELPAGFTGIEYSLAAITRDNPNLQAAIEQVAGYCQKRGVLLAAVGNGHQFVAFVAVRQDTPPMEGRALVFSSLPKMLERFKDFWDALSKIGIEEKRLTSRLLGKAAPSIPPKLSSTILEYPGTKARNKFQTDLKIVSELVLEDVANARELEVEFLKDCYCESGALSEYSLISRDILQARYNALFDEGAPGPTTTPAVTRKGLSNEFFANSLSRRPILILGDVGVGKSTFLRHLMNIDAAKQFQNALSFPLDFGSQAALTLDLRMFLVDEMLRQLRSNYDIDVEEAGLVRGIYDLELQRFSRGIYGELKASQPSAYAEKEFAFLEGKLTDKPQHLKNSLEHIQKARRKQIIIFLDNSDQRTYTTQQQVFLMAQEIASNWPATVFVTLRPETFHLSLRSGGTLSGYHPKAFSISPPRVDRVLERRLNFGLRLTRGQLPIQSLSQVKVQLANLDAIICSFIDSLNSHRDLGEAIDNIAAGNIRVALELVQNFFGSGHVDTEKICRIHAETGRYTVPLHEFLRAVIYGDAVHYDPARSYVGNLFDVAGADPREHFILPILLAHLTTWTGTGSHEGMISTPLLYERLQALGYLPEQIDDAVQRAHRHQLIEISGRRNPEVGKELPPSVRATSDGAYHVERLARLFAYVDAVIVDTPIFDPGIRGKIRDARNLDERLFRAELFCSYLDTIWPAVRVSDGPFMWPTCSETIRAEIRWIRDRNHLGC